jgi:hypothetical protein
MTKAKEENTEEGTKAFQKLVFAVIYAIFLLTK